MHGNVLQQVYFVSRCTFVFEYLCKFKFRHVGSILPLFGNKLATVCSLLKLHYVCLQMVTLPYLIIKPANNWQEIHCMLTDI